MTNPLRDAEPGDPARDRFSLYRLCACSECGGTGKQPPEGEGRCVFCRGEGRTREEIATCSTPEAVGVALVTLGREGEFEECPFGLLDREGEVGHKWIVRPWLPSTRNVRDAARLLRAQQTKGERR